MINPDLKGFVLCPNCKKKYKCWKEYLGIGDIK